MFDDSRTSECRASDCTQTDDFDQAVILKREDTVICGLVKHRLSMIFAKLDPLKHLPYKMQGGLREVTSHEN